MIGDDDEEMYSKEEDFGSPGEMVQDDSEGESMLATIDMIGMLNSHNGSN